MKALVYAGPGEKSWTGIADPEIIDPRDAIIRVDTVPLDDFMQAYDVFGKPAETGAPKVVLSRS